jgi:hypothetical protein
LGRKKKMIKPLGIIFKYFKGIPDKDGLEKCREIKEKSFFEVGWNVYGEIYDNFHKEI